MSKNLNNRMNPADSSEDPDEAQITKAFQELVESHAEATLAGRDEEAMVSALEALLLASQQAEENPTPGLMLMEEADRLECAGDWAGAEGARREALELKQVEGNTGMITKAQHDLSRLYQLRGRLDEGWKSALAATEAARSFDVKILLAMMLENQAWCALLRGEPDPALQAVEEGLRGLEASRLNEGIRSRLWMMQARCFAAQHQWEKTESSLARARELMGMKRYGAWCPGPIGTKAAACEVEAALCAGRGDEPGAIEAWQRAVDCRRQVVGFAHLRGPHTLQALARSLEGLSKALAEHGRADEAAASHHEAAELRRVIEDGCSGEGAKEELR